MSTVPPAGSRRTAPEIAATLIGRRFGLFGFDAAETARLQSVLRDAGCVCSRFEEIWLNESAYLGDALLVRLDRLTPAGLRAAAVSATPTLVIAPVEAVLHGSAGAYGWAADFLTEPWSDAELLARLFRLVAPQRVPDRTPAERSQPLVLLADDDPAWIALAESVLRPHGISCCVATDGFAALRSAREFLPDLMVLDLKMPGIDGLQVLETVRQDPRLSNLRVVLLTGSDESADVDRAAALRADDYLLKPLSPTVLLNRIRRLLSASPPAAPPDSPPTAAVPKPSAVLGA